MTLQEAKNQVAKKHHWDNWADLRDTGIDEGMFELLIDEAAILFAREACCEQREICAKAAGIYRDDDYEFQIDTDSIINAPEPPLL